MMNRIRDKSHARYAIEKGESAVEIRTPVSTRGRGHVILFSPQRSQRRREIDDERSARR